MQKETSLPISTGLSTKMSLRKLPSCSQTLINHSHPPLNTFPLMLSFIRILFDSAPFREVSGQGVINPVYRKTEVQINELQALPEWH